MWIKCKARFFDVKEADKQLKDLGLEDDVISNEMADFAFNSDDVVAFNTYQEGTTIELSTGMIYSTDYPFNDLFAMVGGYLTK